MVSFRHGDGQFARRIFAAEQQIAIRQRATNGKFEVAVPSGIKTNAQFDPVKSAAFVDLVHTVANSNDFAYRF